MILRMRHILAGLAMWMVLMWGGGIAQATTLISEDYEVADVDSLSSRGWLVDNTTDIDGNPVLAIVTCPSGRSGKCFRMQYYGQHVDDCCNGKITQSFTPSPDIWERYYLRYEIIIPGDPTGFSNITAKQHYWNNSTLPDAGSNYFFGSDEIGMGNQTTVMHQCPNGTTDVTCNLEANLATVHQTYGVWRCIETHMSQAAVDMYVDGVQTLHVASPNWVSATNWDTIAVYRQGSDNQYRYEDDFVVATTRVGCSVANDPNVASVGSMVFFFTQSAIVVSTFLQILFIGAYFWERRSIAVQAAVKFWRYAAEVPSPKEMYWAYRYKQAVKRWQNQAPLMLEHKPVTTIPMPKSQERMHQ